MLLLLLLLYFGFEVLLLLERFLDGLPDSGLLVVAFVIVVVDHRQDATAMVVDDR